jgi:hypothetical protein
LEVEKNRGIVLNLKQARICLTVDAKIRINTDLKPEAVAATDPVYQVVADTNRRA